LAYSKRERAQKQSAIIHRIWRTLVNVLASLKSGKLFPGNSFAVKGEIILANPQRSDDGPTLPTGCPIVIPVTSFWRNDFNCRLRGFHIQ